MAKQQKSMVPLKPNDKYGELTYGPNGGVVSKNPVLAASLKQLSSMNEQAISRIPLEDFRDRYLDIFFGGGDVETWCAISGGPTRPVHLTVNGEVKYTVPPLVASIKPVQPIDNGKSSFSMGVQEADKAGSKIPHHFDKMMEHYYQQNSRIITAQNPISKEHWAEILVACGKNPKDFFDMRGDKVEELPQKTTTSSVDHGVTLGEDEDF